MNVDESSRAPDYEQFLQDLDRQYRIQIDPRKFFETHFHFREPVAGGYGIVNFVQNVQGDVMVIKAVRNMPKRHKELYWIWKFRNFPGFVKLLGFFESTHEPPESWTMVDSVTESVWKWPNYLFIVMEYHPLPLAEFMRHDVQVERTIYLFSDQEIVDFFFEFFYIIYYARSLLGYFQHLDIAVRNILVSQEDAPRVYTIRQKRIEIKSRYRPILIDFGFCQGPWSAPKLDLEWSKRNPNRSIDLDYLSIMETLSHIIREYRIFHSLPLSRRLRNILNDYVTENERVCEGDEVVLLENLLISNSFSHTMVESNLLAHKKQYLKQQQQQPTKPLSSRITPSAQHSILDKPKRFATKSLSVAPVSISSKPVSKDQRSPKPQQVMAEQRQQASATLQTVELRDIFLGPAMSRSENKINRANVEIQKTPSSIINQNIVEFYFDKEK